MLTPDETFMRGAFALARRALGRTAPNPAVGAVVVRPGVPAEIVSRGWTMPDGCPHAERVALERAGEAAKGCTLYVTLEPCAHHGRTPPCADAIVEAGISRVVFAAHDPDPRVSGAGIATLREAGIEVVGDVLADEGRRIVLGHCLRMTENRPLVQLKIAVGSDGRIPRGDGAPKWATGETARAHGHLLRARADAILVGRGTVVADDPALTCRLPGMDERSPMRVVLDSGLHLPADTTLVSSAKDVPLWVFCAEDAGEDAANRLREAGVRIERVSRARSGRLDIAAVLTILAKSSVGRLLVEGGPTVAESIWKADLVDEIYVYKGSEPVGSSGLDALSSQGIKAIETAGSFASGETRMLGRDSLTIYRRRDV